MKKLWNHVDWYTLKLKLRAFCARHLVLLHSLWISQHSANIDIGFVLEPPHPVISYWGSLCSNLSMAVIHVQRFCGSWHQLLDCMPLKQVLGLELRNVSKWDILNMHRYGCSGSSYLLPTTPLCMFLDWDEALYSVLMSEPPVLTFCHTVRMCRASLRCVCACARSDNQGSGRPGCTSRTCTAFLLVNSILCQFKKVTWCHK